MRAEDLRLRVGAWIWRGRGAIVGHSESVSQWTACISGRLRNKFHREIESNRPRGADSWTDSNIFISMVVGSEMFVCELHNRVIKIDSRGSVDKSYEISKFFHVGISKEV